MEKYPTEKDCKIGINEGTTVQCGSDEGIQFVVLTSERPEGESGRGHGVLFDLARVDGAVEDVVQLQLIVVTDGSEVKRYDKRRRGAGVRTTGSARG